MAQGRSTENITMIKWIRTSRLSIKELSLSHLDIVLVGGGDVLVRVEFLAVERADALLLAR